MIGNKSLVLCCACWLLMRFIGFFQINIALIADIAAIIFLIVALLDAILLFFIPLPKCNRLKTEILSLDQKTNVKIEITNIHRLIKKLSVFDMVPSSFLIQGLPAIINVHHRKNKITNLNLEYIIIPNKRGRQEFGKIQVRFDSILKFWSRTYESGEETTVKIFPSFLKNEKATLALMNGKNSINSLHQVQRRGHGTEFYQLRDYQEGDVIKLIDWKSTSKYQKLIMKELQDEQNQDIIFLLDTGYRMNACDGNISHFDRALESVLFLSHIALKQGDAVGLMTFGSEEIWLSPQKGKTSLNRLLNSVYDLESKPVASSPALALEKLHALIKRRTLIILVSNLREEDRENIEAQAALISRNNLLITLWMKESIVDELIKTPYKTISEATTAAAVRLYIDERQHIQKIWQKKGITVIDTTPSLLTVNLVNTYWNIKRSGKL